VRDEKWVGKVFITSEQKGDDYPSHSRIDTKQISEHDEVVTGSGLESTHESYFLLSGYSKQNTDNFSLRLLQAMAFSAPTISRFLNSAQPQFQHLPGLA
jgi:hypothetical protein